MKNCDDKRQKGVRVFDQTIGSEITAFCSAALCPPCFCDILFLSAQVRKNNNALMGFASTGSLRNTLASSSDRVQFAGKFNFNFHISYISGDIPDRNILRLETFICIPLYTDSKYRSIAQKRFFAISLWNRLFREHICVLNEFGIDNFVDKMNNIIDKIGDFVYNINYFVDKIGDFVYNINYFVDKIGDFVYKIGDFVYKIGDFVYNINYFVDKNNWLVYRKKLSVNCSI